MDMEISVAKSFTVWDLPVEERPRERLYQHGEEALSAQELLQVILGRGAAGESVSVMAQKLITHFGNLKSLSEASLEELSSIKGIGLAKAAQLKAAFEIGRRLMFAPPLGNGKELNTPEKVYQLVRSKLKDHSREHFYIILLNTRNISLYEISVGTLNTSLVHPREVFAEAIKHRAASLILAHNHPSGDTTPSQQDKELTKRLVDAGKLLCIEVLDHVIVTQNAYLSFKQKGLL